MTNTYKTLNPLGSNNARDLSDNASNFDEYFNSQQPSIKDRFDRRRETIYGNQVAFDDAQEGRSADFAETQEMQQEAFNTFIDGLGWSSLGIYTAGISITSHSQFVEYNGQPYSLKPTVPASTSSPFVTTGNWGDDGDSFKLQNDNDTFQALVIEATAARDAAQLAAGVFPNTAAGISGTADGAYFNTPGTDATSLILWHHVGATAVEVTRYPSLAAVMQVLGLIAPNIAPDDFLVLADEERNRLLTLRATLLELPFVAFGVATGQTTIKDSEGNVSFKHNESTSILGHLTAGDSRLAGLRVIDGEFNVINDLSKPLGLSTGAQFDPFVGGLLFQPRIAVSALYPSTIYPMSILAKRDLSGDVVATLTGDYGSAGSVTGKALSTADMGANPVLNLRASWSEESRKFITLNLITAPTQTALPIKVLMIGDSITNRQGPFLLDKYLRQMGCIPQFIGTMHSSASNTSSSSNTGALAEPREGWETGDYTNAITDRSIIIPPGGEAAYLSMSKADQRDRNPFARAAVSGDSPSIVRNGYVVDFAFYQSRFGLDTPDVVVYTMGTNDFRDRQPSAVYDTLLSNDTIMLGQMKAAWPNVKIIRSVPGTSYDAARNDLWEASYAPGIRGMRQAIANVGGTGITLAPLWAMANPEGGYAIPEASADSDGFVSGAFSDTIHPIGSTREQLYKAMAPFVLAAKLDLI